MGDSHSPKRHAFRYVTGVLRAPRSFWLALGLVVALLGLSRTALAAREDKAVSGLVDGVLDSEYADASYGAAKTKLEDALKRCSRNRCSPTVKARVYVALGMVSSQIGMASDAKANFKTALELDSSASLPASGTSPNIRSQFEAAKKAVAPEPAPKAAEPSAGADGGKIPGWKSREAFQLASAGLRADLAGKLDECIEKDKASVAIEDQPRTRLHLASCEMRHGKLIDALRDAQKALESGIKKKDKAVMRAARKRVQQILPKIAHVTFIPPEGVEDLKVSFDERPVPKEALQKQFSIDPGKHQVHAEGVVNNVPLEFDEEFNVKEGELLKVKITLRSRAPEFLTRGQLKCMLAAKSQDDVKKCLPEDKKNLVVRVGSEIGAYTDTNAVHVLTPGFNGSLTSPTSGWNVGGNFLVDVYTAASPDIVSMASPFYRERRYAGGLTGGYKPGLYGAQANANVSSEPDYLSMSAGLTLQADIMDKRATPSISYNGSSDTIGRNATSFDSFSRKFYTNTVAAGVTVVMSATSVLLLSGSFSAERGDQSKVYRHVPMFVPDIAERIPRGATVDLVDAFRLPFRPNEQLPTERDRYAGGFRFAHRFKTSTLRVSERVYYDTWGIKGSSTDTRYMQDLGRMLRVWPHFRLHMQSGANFHRRAYTAVVSPNGQITVPTYRTGDREFAPMVTVTAGGGARIALSPAESATQFGLTITGDLMYTRFLDSLFVTNRTAVYGAVAFDAEFE